MPHVSLGSFVAALYDRKMYIGKVLEFDAEDGEVVVLKNICSSMCFKILSFFCLFSDLVEALFSLLNVYNGYQSL